MLFNSYLFILCFLPVSVTGYFLINRYFVDKREYGKRLWLIAASLIFFAYAGIEFVPILMASMGVNYLFSKAVKKQTHTQKRRFILALGISVQLLLLFYYKYTGFLFHSLNQIWQNNIVFSVQAPLGISFFTFSQLSYLVDCYKGKDKEKGFLNYCTYVTFFPKLTMGPIALPNDFLPQLRSQEKEQINYNNLSKGLYLFALGLAKKVLIADTLAKIVSIGYSQVDSLNTITALVVMLSYTFQLYFDFSGYCDMAMAVALFFNIELPLNFNSPYRAKSIREFWSRWHMTLTRFFTTYLYIPLGGSRKGKLRTYGNTFFVFLISGLWHGANWTFLFWGGLHGAVMVLEKITEDLKPAVKHLPPAATKIKSFLQWLTTFLVINVAWVFFRADSIKQAKLFLSRLFVGGWQLSEKIREYVLDIIEIRVIKRLGMGRVLETRTTEAVILLLLILLILCIFGKNAKEKTEGLNYTIKNALITMVLLVWCVISLSNVSEFLYFEF